MYVLGKERGQTYVLVRRKYVPVRIKYVLTREWNERNKLDLERNAKAQPVRLGLMCAYIPHVASLQSAAVTNIQKIRFGNNPRPCSLGLGLC